MERLVLVFFVYGLAFFSMGLAIAFESRRPSELLLSRPLRLLAAFGLLHGLVEWIDMWMIAPGVTTTVTPVLRILRLVLFAASTVALAQFGADVLASILPEAAAVRWVPLALIIFWTVNWAVLPHLTGMTVGDVASTPSCLRCHAASPLDKSGGVPVAFTPAMVLADVWLRYLIYLPGSLLAAAGFWLEGRRLAGLSYPQIASDCRWTAWAFVGNAIMAGLVVPPASVFPASVLNYDRFLSVVGVPPQLFRAGIAVLIALLTLRVLRVFEQEAARRLSQAGAARLAAQQETLAAVQQARAAAEEWSRTLEERVSARTQELERRGRELAALNAIASTVTSSLDLHQVLAATVDHVLELIGGDSGEITLLPVAPGEEGVSVSRGHATDIERIRGFEPGTAATGSASFEEAGPPRPFIKVPLKSKDRLLGELTVLGKPHAHYSEDDLRLLSTVAQQVGVAVENASLFQETATRRREAETLFRVGTEIAVLSDAGRVLDLVVASARELLGADAAMLSLLDEHRGRVVVRAADGLRVQSLVGADLAPGQGIAGYVMLTGRPLVVNDYVTDLRITHELDDLVRHEGLQTHLAVPIASRGRAIGALAVAYRRMPTTSDDDVHLLHRMANQAAIAIENARLYEQVQSLAILEERDRLGREMHDSLGQSLGFLNLKAKLAEDLVGAGRTREAEEELVQMRATIREAYDEVRHAILGLRASGARDDLETALRVQITRFRDQTRLPVVYDAPGPVPSLPGLAVVQVTRIVQEALTNVRKHAKASAVTVTLTAEGGQVVVRVTDNGRGFDTAAIQAEAGARFGLETMRERAESIGGALDVTSAPGKGTTVSLALPVTHGESAAGEVGR